MQKFKAKNFITVKKDSFDTKFLALCIELKEFYVTNIDEENLESISALRDFIDKFSPSNSLLPQLLSKKLGGDFVISKISLLGYHFLIILEKSEESSLSDENLVRSEFFQTKFRRAVYWENIDTKSKILLECLAKKDIYTAGHTKRVGILCKELSHRMGLNDYQSKVCYYSGLLHDVGKIAINDAILKKNGSLTEGEFNIMKEHPVFSYEILKNHLDNRDIIDGVKFHHEKYDGSGYPNQLSGNQIPLASRMVAVADTFDALISHRPYRKGIPPQKAVEKLREIRAFYGFTRI